MHCLCHFAIADTLSCTAYFGAAEKKMVQHATQAAAVLRQAKIPACKEIRSRRARRISSQCRDSNLPPGWKVKCLAQKNSPDQLPCFTFYFVPDEPDVPEVPEDPDVPEEPDDFDEPLPDMPDDDVPLEPEVWSPARRSQPANATERAATISRTCDVLTRGFIVVPFIKMDNVSFLTMALARSSSHFCKAWRKAIASSHVMS